jgi:hypothetical protein
MRHHRRPDRIRNGDRIAAEAERHRRDGAGGERRQAEIAGNRHRRQHVRHIEMADGEPVADIGPGGLPHQRQRNALPSGEADFACRYQQGAVEERHEAGGDLVLGVSGHGSSGEPSNPAAVTRLWAMSLILRFWFMAVLRSSV